MIMSLQATPFKTPLELEGHASSLRQGSHFQVDKGTQREISRKISIETVEKVMAPATTKKFAKAERTRQYQQRRQHGTNSDGGGANLT